MPFVHIRISSKTITSAQIAHLQKEATHLMATVMRKRAKLTAVLVDRSEPAAWSIGGEPALVAGHLDVKVTAGTNTPTEKAAFVAQANSLLKDVLGADVPVATYVVIHEIPADSWGYDGKTQEARHQSSSDPATISTAQPVASRRIRVLEMLVCISRLMTFQPLTQKS